MAQVLLEGIYRVWVDVDAETEEEAYEKVDDMSLEEIFGENDVITIQDIEDLQPIDFVKD